ncbi:hypothetical protein E3P99_00252 [Wallemia hederae]|uniref:Phosphatidic acid phosphatase type 2/haloperoxidase domain-containing protein n=1 Tax=Wallemia hederae TaxID=1540922 RepID=A0A4T0FZ64_9BASI|nr:hypothetical protein E3P99_00252 [Wallemia hederae]
MTTLSQLTHLDLTYVQYTHDSLLSYALAHVTLLPFVTLSAYAAIVYVNRDALFLNAFTGQLINEALNLVLKRLFKIRRPNIGTGYGMPSSHAQFAAYAATFLILHQLRKQGRLDNQARCALLVAIIVAYSRHHLHYHTINQIVVGWLVGVSFAVIYFSVTELSCGRRCNTNTNSNTKSKSLKRSNRIQVICHLLRSTRLYVVHTLSLNDPTLDVRQQ